MRPFKNHVISTSAHLETQKLRHLDRSRAASSRGEAERPLYFAFIHADHRNH